MPQTLHIRDVVIHKGALDRTQQETLVATLRDIIRAAPLVTPTTPWGKPMSVRMSAAGRFGWISDRKGYRYSEIHPNGASWPAIPGQLMQIWQTYAPKARAPECCLINWYGETARMGLHQDRDEADMSQPVLSVSLGDDGRFRLGHTTKGGTTESVWLQSGDIALLTGPSRLIYHGIDKIRPGSSTLFDAPGRLNLTLRVVT